MNDLIRAIQKHEVRGTGVETSACCPIEWDEFMMLLVAARLVFLTRESSMYMILAVMALQWHFIGRIDDIMELEMSTIEPNLCHPFCLQLKMRKSKNIRSERDMPTQIFFASMDPLVCPVLNLAVYVEMFGTGETTKSGVKIFNWKNKRQFSDLLDKLFDSQHFKIGGPAQKMSFFQMAPGSILSIQIHSNRSQYELYEVWFNNIDHIHTYGAAKVNIFS